MSESARLSVYRPIDDFEGADRRYWEAYVATFHEVPDRHDALFQARLRERLGFSGDDVIVDAWVKWSRGVAHLSPFYEKLGYEDQIPGIVAALPDHLRRYAVGLLDRPRIAHMFHRRVEPHHLPCQYPPPAVFLSFVPSERRRRLRPAAPPDERGYVSRAGRLRRRLDRLVPVVESTGHDDALRVEIAVVTRFLAPHADHSIVELRYRAAPGSPGREAEEEGVARLRERVRSARRGVLFARGLISVRPLG